MEKRVKKIIELLEKEYPRPKTALRFNTPFQLLVATILSAQTTDERVNRVTETLMSEYKEPSDFASAGLDEIENHIRTVNFYRNKAKNIRSLSEQIVTRFNSRVPKTMSELVTLPGVARKTANVVLSEAFGISEGIVVDTHVKRLSGRLELSSQKTPEKIEQDLMKLLPLDKWASFPFRLILHGRRVCKARRPVCADCIIERYCNWGDKTL